MAQRITNSKQMFKMLKCSSLKFILNIIYIEFVFIAIYQLDEDRGLRWDFSSVNEAGETVGWN